MFRPAWLPPTQPPSLLLQIWRANNYYQNMLKSVLNQHGLTFKEYALIVTLADGLDGHSASQIELAELMGIARQSLENLLPKLTGKDLIYIQPMPIFDDRAKRIIAKPKVRIMLLEIRRALLPYEAEIQSMGIRDFRPFCRVPKAKASWWKHAHAARRQWHQ